MFFDEYFLSIINLMRLIIRNDQESNLRKIISLQVKTNAQILFLQCNVYSKRKNITDKIIFYNLLI